jgi:pSer/pThr/pTyr-binding forkhead associated (FHA) protein
MVAIAINTLYTSSRRRGTTRQLTGAIVTCVISALLLLPAFVWYNARFNAEQAALATAEVEVALAYVALWGWLLPLSVTVAYSLFTLPRLSTDSVGIAKQYKHAARDDSNTSTVMMPQHQPGTPVTPAPFVFGEDTPWGWLEHRVGRFQGQRLALTRAIIKIGREEDNDIWLDDDMASRYHAELAWNQGAACVTDCGSLNGVLLNGRPIRGSASIKQGEVLEIGSHQLLFEYAERASVPAGQDDPLLRHMRRSSLTPTPASDDQPPATTPLEQAGSSQPDISTARTTPLTPLPLSPGIRVISGPAPLRLPSKPKKE